MGEGETEGEVGREDNTVLHCSSRANKCFYFVDRGPCSLLFTVTSLSSIDSHV